MFKHYLFSKTPILSFSNEKKNPEKALKYDHFAVSQHRALHRKEINKVSKCP